jgi:M6 family metalloprotease-like protein
LPYNGDNPFFMSKKSSLAKTLLSGFALVCLCGCAKGTSGNYVYLEGSGLAKKNLSSLTYHDFAFQSRGGGGDSLKGIGKEKILLLPIQFSDFPFSASVLQDINTAFNGSAEDTAYWQSVSSFYAASSFGASELSFSVAPLYDSGYSMSSFLKHSPAHSLRSADILRDALSDYKSKNKTTGSEFDGDGNGHIDGVFLIYSAPDYQTFAKSYPAVWSGFDEAEKKSYQENFWAYSSNDNAGSDLASPLANAYSWASSSFMYKGVKQGVGVDAHTYIHETGHLYGLDDYYNYAINEDGNSSPYRYYVPTGGLDMMDANILDHDAWSKAALGWIAPYVVDNSLTYPFTVELGSSESSGDFLLIPTGSYSGNVFDEYLMVEFYTPSGLNALDAASAYAGSYPRGFFSQGIKISHIDARIGLVNSLVSPSLVSYLGTQEMVKATFTHSSPSSYYRVIASNTPLSTENSTRKSVENPGYRLIHLLESNGVNTFANSDYATYQSFFYANNNTLFQPQDGYSEFSMSKFASFFENHDFREAGLFNSGAAFPYTIRLNGYRNVDGAMKASLTISKVA